MTFKQKTFFVIVIFLAVFFRFYEIRSMPGGLFPDEAANGLDINLMQQGHLQPFYERGNGREALFFYMLWGSVEAFGKGPWQHHVVSALVGVLSVILCFLVTRKLFDFNLAQDDLPGKKRAVNIALLAAFLMAVSTWHIVLSRTAFRAILIPLFTSLTFYFLLYIHQSENKKKYLYSFLAGASFALGFYTYIAYRILVPIIGILVLWPWLASGIFFQIKRYWRQFILFTFTFLLFFYPLGKYFYTHPGSFVGRSGQVSVFNPELNQGNLIGAVWEVSKESMLAYFTRGDLNWRHNISGFPFLSQLVSPFFSIALIVVTFFAAWYIFTPRKRSKFWKYCLLAGWFWGMLIPVITTAEGIPHGLRSIGTMPAVFIISALGLYWCGEIFLKLRSRIKFPISGLEIFGFKLLIVCFGAALVLQTYLLYFVYAYNSPDNFYSFRSDLTVVSNYLVQHCDKIQTYLILDKFSVQTTDYLTSNQHGNFNDKCNVPYIQVDPENSWELIGLKPSDEIVFTQSSLFDTKKFKQYHPEAHLSLEYRNKFNQTVMAVYKVN